MPGIAIKKSEEIMASFLLKAEIQKPLGDIHVVIRRYAHAQPKLGVILEQRV